MRRPEPLWFAEGLANVYARPLSCMLFAAGLSALTLGAVLPALRSDTRAVQDAVEIVEQGGITYEMTAAHTSSQPTIPSHECDSASATGGVTNWSGALSTPTRTRPRGELTLPVSVYTASGGFLRHAASVPTTGAVLVGAAYAEEAGIIDGTTIDLFGEQVAAVVVTLPADIEHLSRSIFVPDAGFDASTCVIGLSYLVWDDTDAAVAAVVPAGAVDWMRRCVGCGGAGIDDVARIAARGQTGPAVFATLGATVLAVLFALTRRSEWALYTAVGFRRGALQAMAATEATALALGSLTATALIVGLTASADLRTVGEHAWMYALVTAVTAAVFVAVVTATSVSAGRRSAFSAMAR